ncbi:hypothetical protein B0H14DRAFT_3594210 [Mycena olivaceomarginata]|nr:hypothetical protein B0H14DRAFT_3594210 [Mycena olivaceomarginata]
MDSSRRLTLLLPPIGGRGTARLALVHAAGPCSWCVLEKGDLRLPEDEEEAKRRKQHAMKGKRKEAQQVNENGEVRGVPEMGEKARITSWIWYAAGGAEGLVGEAMHEGVRVEWSKVYARVKRWREEGCLLQEEMVRCLITLEWQAIQWDQCTTPTHYTGQIVYGATHVQGAMALAARQAAGQRKLASRFHRLWCKVSDRVAQANRGVSSSESSYSSGDSSSDDSDDEGGLMDEQGEPGPHTPGQPENQGHTPEGDEGGDLEEHGSEGDNSEEDNGGDVERRRDEMDKLLAIHTASLIQYDEL